MRTSTRYTTLAAALLALAIMALSVPVFAASPVPPKDEWLLPLDYKTTKTYPSAEAAKADTEGQELDDWPMFLVAWKVLERKGDLVHLVTAISTQDAEASITAKEGLVWGIAKQWVPLTDYVNNPANAKNTLCDSPELRSFSAPLDTSKGQDKVTFSMVAVPTARSAGIMIEAKAQDGTLLWSGFPVPMIPGDGMDSAFYADTFGFVPELVADFSGKGKAGIMAGKNRHEKEPGIFRLYAWDGNTFAGRGEVTFWQQTLPKGTDPTTFKRLPADSIAFEELPDTIMVWIDQWHSREADGSFRVKLMVNTAENWHHREALVKGDPFNGDMTFVRWLGEALNKS